ncbi:MAG TPA: hypothetical protein VIY48_02540 [Candidatus Paceibacterota bacterium]
MDAAKVRALELQKYLVKGPRKPHAFIMPGIVVRRQPGDFRVYEIARKAGVSSREVINYMQSVGLKVKSPSTLVPPLCSGVILRHFQGGE